MSPTSAAACWPRPSGMDKAVMKVAVPGPRPARARLGRSSGAATGAPIARRSCARRSSSALAYPLFVKPANLGSSVGISKVHDRDELAPAIELARRVRSQDHRRSGGARRARDRVRGARQRRRRRPRCPARSCRRASSTTTKPSTSTAGSRTEIPAALDDDDRRARSSGRRVAAFHAIDGAGLARVDFLLSRATGELFVNEINTLPGFTTISMYLEAVGGDAASTTRRSSIG